MPKEPKFCRTSMINGQCSSASMSGPGHCDPFEAGLVDDLETAMTSLMLSRKKTRTNPRLPTFYFSRYEPGPCNQCFRQCWEVLNRQTLSEDDERHENGDDFEQTAERCSEGNAESVLFPVYFEKWLRRLHLLFPCSASSIRAVFTRLSL